ncbi:hypothetical protein PLCT1_01425 [Planctomycetaceae bacterium]|nr:hypothetical protein PLCT1_01425 [Planctomycetaceae bacterium]
MCGRIYVSARHLVYIQERQPDLFATWQAGQDDRADRGDIRPTQKLPCVRFTEEGPQMVSMRWGFVRKESRPPLIINARTDSFGRYWREAATQRRCTVFASGFYEWKDNALGAKEVYAFTRAQQGPLWLAGLYEMHPEHGLCVSVVTTRAAGLMSVYHDRMPAILDAQDVEAWLSPKTGFEAARNIVDRPNIENLLIFPCWAPRKEHIPEPGEISDKCNFEPHNESELKEHKPSRRKPRAKAPRESAPKKPKGQQSMF